MSKVEQSFQNLKSKNRKGLVPFVTAGDPDLATTVELIKLFDEMGCAVCEVGIPYSDPIADGPVIQASYTRALDKKITVEQIFQAIESISTQVNIPIVVMVSFAIVDRWGVEKFAQRCKKAGVAGAIIPDLLVDEATPVTTIFSQEGLVLIELVTPTTPRDRALQIARSSSGFVYYVSVTGITGERRELPAQLLNEVTWLRSQTNLPVCIGFGISGPDQVAQLTPVADGAIVGSAIVRRVHENAIKGQKAILDDIRKFVGELIEATKF